MRRSPAVLMLQELEAECMLAGADPQAGAAAVIAATSVFLSMSGPRTVDAYLAMLSRAARSVARSERLRRATVGRRQEPWEVDGE